MTQVYIALEDAAGQLVVKGPLSLLDQLVTTLTGQQKDHAEAVKTESRAESKECDHETRA